MRSISILFIAIGLLFAGACSKKSKQAAEPQAPPSAAPDTTTGEGAPGGAGNGSQTGADPDEGGESTPK